MFREHFLYHLQGLIATGYKIKTFTVFVRSGDKGGGGDGCSGYVLNVQGEEGGYQN